MAADRRVMAAPSCALTRRTIGNWLSVPRRRAACCASCVTAAIVGLNPDEHLQSIFGIQKSRVTHAIHISQDCIVSLVFNAWCTWLKSKPESCNVVSIAAAILSQRIPAVFQRWTKSRDNQSDIDCESCPELVLRDAWGGLQWDQEILAALRDPASRPQCCIQQPYDRKDVWDHIQQEVEFNTAKLFAIIWEELILRKSHSPNYRVGKEVVHDGSRKRETPSADDLQLSQGNVYQDAGPMEVVSDAKSSMVTDKEKNSSGDGATKVVRLEFSRNPATFHQLLEDGIDDDDMIQNLMLEDLVSCKRVLEQNGFEWRLSSGAYLFVPPELHRLVQEHIDTRGVALSPSHIVLTEALEAPVMRAVLSLPRKHKISLQGRKNFIDMFDPPSGAAASSPQMDSEVSGGPRTVSTTDTEARKGQIPRLHVGRDAHVTP